MLSPGTTIGSSYIAKCNKCSKGLAYAAANGEWNHPNAWVAIVGSSMTELYNAGAHAVLPEVACPKASEHIPKQCKHRHINSKSWSLLPRRNKRAFS